MKKKTFDLICGLSVLALLAGLMVYAIVKYHKQETPVEEVVEAVTEEVEVKEAKPTKPTYDYSVQYHECEPDRGRLCVKFEFSTRTDLSATQMANNFMAISLKPATYGFTEKSITMSLNYSDNRYNATISKIISNGGTKETYNIVMEDNYLSINSIVKSREAAELIAEEPENGGCYANDILFNPQYTTVNYAKIILNDK